MLLIGNMQTKQYFSWKGRENADFRCQYFPVRSGPRFQVIDGILCGGWKQAG